MFNQAIKKVRVRCSGHFHEIGLNQKGQLIFYNHTKEELKTEQALCELGAEPCGCLKFLEKWRKEQFYRKEFAYECEIIKEKRNMRLKNRNKRYYRIIDLAKSHQKLYIRHKADFSKKLAKRTLLKQNAQIVNVYVDESYDYLGNFKIATEITFTYLNNTFSLLFYYDWWKIYKLFKGGIIDNKIIMQIEDQTTDSYIVSAIDLLMKHKHYKLKINKNLQNWRILKEEILT